MNWNPPSHASCFAQICFNNKKYTNGSNLINSCFALVVVAVVVVVVQHILQFFLHFEMKFDRHRRIELNLKKQSSERTRMF